MKLYIYVCERYDSIVIGILKVQIWAKKLEKVAIILNKITRNGGSQVGNPP